jgi:predicted metal-dependent hydrolase
MEVQVVRSPRRRKTVEAKEIDGVLRVTIPAWMSSAEEAQWVEKMSGRFSRRRRTEGIDLHRRAQALSRRLDLPMPNSIRWVDNQRMRWGSCTPADGAIRLSSRMAGFPLWVIDAVIVHELAHLVELGHGPRFWELADRYHLAERAKGFLIAKGLEL